MNQTISELTSRALDVLTESASRIFITGLLTGATVVFVISRKILLNYKHRIETELRQLRTNLAKEIARRDAIRDKRAKAAAEGTKAARL